MRTRVLLAAISLAIVALFGAASPVGAQEHDPVEDDDPRGRGERRHPRRRRVHRGPRRGRLGRRLPRGAEPDPPAAERAGVGEHLLRHRRGPAVEAGLPRHQEGHGGPHRADPLRPRGGRERQGRAGEGPGRVPGPAGRRPQRVGPHHRGGPPGRRRRCAPRRSPPRGEIAEMRQRAAADIESAKAQALADLRGEVTSLALGAAERVVEANLDDATNRALIDSYIDRSGPAADGREERSPTPRPSWP